MTRVDACATDDMMINDMISATKAMQRDDDGGRETLSVEARRHPRRQ